MSIKFDSSVLNTVYKENLKSKNPLVMQYEKKNNSFEEIGAEFQSFKHSKTNRINLQLAPFNNMVKKSSINSNGTCI